MRATGSARTTRFPEGPTTDTVGVKFSALQQGWAELLQRFRWEWAVNPTFSDKKFHPHTKRRAIRAVENWVELISRIYRRPPGIVVAVENSPAGRWHCHALFVGLGGRSPRTAEMVWRERNGITHSKRVDSVGGVTLYSTKQAGSTGYVVLNEYLRHHRDHLADEPVIRLWP